MGIRLNPEFEHVPDYGVVFFDNVVRGDYSLVKTAVGEGDRAEIEEILARRQSGELTWQDISTFDLIVLRYVDLPTLKRKIKTMRETLAWTAPAADETKSLVNKTDLDAAAESNREALVTEYSYLISEYCQRAAFVAATEHLRRRLLKRGTLFTLAFFVVVATFVGYTYFGPADRAGPLNAISTLLMVVFAGMTGAFISILQRLTTTDTNANPLARLSILSDNWLGIFLTPLSGAIFAVVLYMFFAGGLIEGTLFPELVVPKNQQVKVTGGLTETSDPVPSVASNDLGTSDYPLQFKKFLSQTGPLKGKDFALLLIWSIIAGLAERFVPDNLMRLVRARESETANAANQ